MARNSPKQFAAHLAARGLPPTLPPPPAVVRCAEVRVRANRLRHEAGAVLAVANQTDPIAASCLRMIGAGILSDADALELVAESWERNR